MFFHIRELELGSIRFHETLLPGVIEFTDQQIYQSAPLETSGVAELSAALREIRVTGHLATSMQMSCDRCLEPTNFPIDTDFSLLYRPAAYMPEAEETAIAPAETDVGFYEGDGLELGDVLREQILLSLPMQRICHTGCLGICPICGQNRNLLPCDCHADRLDDRWAGLRNL
jgi:uncharacterized protein